QRSKVGFPYLAARRFAATKGPIEPVGDGVADKEKVDIPLLCDIDKRLMSSIVPLIVEGDIGRNWSAPLSRAWRWTACCRRTTNGRLGQQQRRREQKHESSVQVN